MYIIYYIIYIIEIEKKFSAVSNIIITNKSDGCDRTYLYLKNAGKPMRATHKAVKVIWNDMRKSNARCPTVIITTLHDLRNDVGYRLLLTVGLLTTKSLITKYICCKIIIRN